MSKPVMGRKRLVVVSPSLSGGGAERFTSTLLCHIDRERFEPHLCLLRDDISYPLPIDVPVSLLHKYSPLDIPRTIFRLRRQMRFLSPDVVLGTMISTNWLIGAARAPDLRFRWVGRFAISLQRQENFRELAFSRMVGIFLRQMDAWVGNSQKLALEIQEVFGVPQGRVFSIANPIDVSEIEGLANSSPSTRGSLPAGGKVIVSVGRLSPQKRYDVLIDAFAKVRAERRVRLIICGDGPLRDDLQRRVDDLGIGDDVTIFGHDINPFPRVRQSDLFVLTSDHEGLPNALIEAQVLGLPAVATRCPTGPDEIVVDGVTGLLVPVGNVEAVATAILDLVSDEDRRRRMGAAARERARRLFDHRKVMAEWEDVLDPPGREVPI